jgi:hypothetical protein
MTSRMASVAVHPASTAPDVINATPTRARHPGLRRRTSRLPAPRPPACGRANPRVAPTRRP